jgi:NhaP-type Na+/H+ or K+/H+ antiporter
MADDLESAIGYMTAITFAVVAFSVFAQGLTITPLLRRLGQLK